MNTLFLKKSISTLSSIHWCIDDIRFLDWICKKRLQFWMLKVFRFGFSPLLLQSVNDESSLDERSRLHTLATSYLRAGNTVKTTGKSRTLIADQCVLDVIENITSPSLLEVGVSDGSSAMDLLRVKERFSKIKLTDRFPHFYVRKGSFNSRFYDVEGYTHGSKWFCFLLDPRDSRKEDISGLELIKSINPSIIEEFGIDSIEYFDVFESRDERVFDVIKCSNLLNSIYFDLESIKKSLKNLSESLVEAGHIVLSQNNSKYENGEAVIVLQRLNNKLRIVKQINNHDLLAPLEAGEIEIG